MYLMRNHDVWIYVRCANSDPRIAFDRLYDLIDEAAGHGLIDIKNGAANRIAQYETGYRTPKAEIVEKIAKVLNVREETFYMPNDTIVDLIRTLIWYDWEHSLPFQDFGDSTQCFLLRIRLSCSHPAVKALLADWRIHRTAFENGRITSSDYLEWMLQWPPTLSAPDD